MGHKAIFRAKKLRTKGNVGGSGEHNFRARKTLNADPERLNLNEHTGANNTDELFAALDARLSQLDEIDHQAVPLVEMLVTAAHAAFEEGGGQVSSTAYFDDAVAWTEQKFGKENVIATTRHYDELTPHLVLYVVPVREIEAKTRKRSVIVGKDHETGKQLREIREYPMPARITLSAKHWFGGRQKLSNMQTEFAAKVGAKHGLERGTIGSKARHVTVKQFYSNLQQPVVPIPKPPQITKVIDLVTANKVLAEYTQRLRAALLPLQVRARDRDNHAVHRSNPTDRARAEAAEALNEHNKQQIMRLQQQLEQQAILYNEFYYKYELIEAEKDNYKQLLESEKKEIVMLKERIEDLQDPLSSHSFNQH